MEKKYLEVARPADLENPFERKMYRFLEILPGTLSWLTLFLALILSWLAPYLIAVFIIAFDFYWLLRIFYLSLHQLFSFFQMRKNLKTNWLEKISTIPQWKEIYHLVALPMYKESFETVKPTFQSLVNSFYPKEKMIVVLAIEERGGKKAQKVAEKIKKEFSNKFFRFLIAVHPQNLPGELAGKGSNLNWAIKKTKEKIIDSLKIPYQKIIVSIFDIDTRVYPQYFACLTYHFLTAKKPLRSSYQPIPVYNNNIWYAPIFSRIIATSGTFWQMMQQERPEQLITYSSHSMPFEALIEVGYPVNLVSDDSRIFWKCYFYFDGDWRVIPLHYPVSMDTVMAKNLFKTLVNQYRQQRRWSWGVENIPYLIFCFFKNKKISLFEKIRHSFIALDGFWSWATASLLIFFLGWLPISLGGERFIFTLLSYNLPRITGFFMTIAMLGMFVSAGISFLLLPPRPSNLSAFKNFSMFFQWFLLPLTLIIFGSIPALESQTRLMLGKYLGFWVTEKFSFKEKGFRVSKIPTSYSK